MMKTLLLTTTLALAISAPAFAAGTHADGHAMVMAIGQPAEGEAMRTITVTMKETDSGMAFEPATLDFKTGETVKIVVVNAGAFEHEFVMDTAESNIEHKAVMEKFPEMEHDDPNSVRLDAGATGELVWTFSNPGTFEFACLLPGHSESGMYGLLTVGDTFAEVQADFTRGMITKVDARAGKVTIMHEALVNLGMPSMTMVFRADEAMIASMAEGQEITFIAGRVNGKLTVTAMR